VELEFYNDELYQLGVRNHVDASELEEYWLDNKASLRSRGEPAPFPSEEIGAAITQFYPDVVNDPENWSFMPLRPVLQGIGFKIDKVMTEAAPRGRGIYNKDRAEIIRRTRRMQAERALERGRLYPRGVEVELWRRAIRVDHIGPGEMSEVELGGQRLVVVNANGEYYALEGGCSHAPELSALKGLASGDVDQEKLCITCPWHGAQFNLRSGRTVRQPYAPEFNRQHLVAGRILSAVDVRRKAADIRTYETKVEDNYVWVNVV
jgi:nitrite reductase/ring-hydroxylating ferredoxin subunit